MLLWEKKVFHRGSRIIIGVDEAGRGPLAGPVVAAAVIFYTGKRETPYLKIPDFNCRIDDSKKLTAREREKAFKEIAEKTIFNIGIKDNIFIDNENIHNATICAMRDAIQGVIRYFCHFNNKNEESIRDDICILVDGNLRLDLPYKIIHIIKGDAKSFSIASASIVAKVVRDRIMKLYDMILPNYGFRFHKGYATRLHIERLRRYGPSYIHRKTFRPMNKD